MPHVDKAKVFMNGRSQAVRIPAAFRFTAKEVYIRKDPQSGDIILSPRLRKAGKKSSQLSTEPVFPTTSS